MEHWQNLVGFRFTTNESSATDMAADQTFGFELRVRVGDRGAMDAELHSEFAARRKAVSEAQFACVYQGAKLVAQLDVEWNVAFGLQVYRNHWLSQPDQYSPVLCQVKSQFVFRQAEAATTRMTCRSCDLDCLFRQRSALPADFSRTGTLDPKPLRGAACPRMLMLRRDRTGQARVPVLPKGGS